MPSRTTKDFSGQQRQGKSWEKGHRAGNWQAQAFQTRYLTREVQKAAIKDTHDRHPETLADAKRATKSCTPSESKRMTTGLGWPLGRGSKMGGPVIKRRIFVADTQVCGKPKVGRPWLTPVRRLDGVNRKPQGIVSN